MNIKCFTIFALAILFTINLQAQEITTFNGFFGANYYQDEKEISSFEVESLMKTNTEAYKHWQKHRTLASLTVGFAVVQFGFLVWTFVRIDGDIVGNVNKVWTPLLLGSVFTGLTIHFSLSSETEKKHAVITYNEGLEEVSTLHFGPTRNGIGFVYSF